ncbi:helix-turn-helix transcriptional regulator [Methylobacter sp.]|uniref:helix-turn-helix transcriptional regulator n=1 Tax=Methylobacter sp. TaxID=2051955 RepID=UPI002FDDB12B
MSKVNTISRIDLLNQFNAAPDDALFDQKTIAAVRDCSLATMERDRWAGTGIPFIKLGRSVKYRKADVLLWLDKHHPQQSTSSAA